MEQGYPDFLGGPPIDPTEEALLTTGPLMTVENCNDEFSSLFAEPNRGCSFGTSLLLDGLISSRQT